MASDDWYRNDKWNDEIEESFFSKLRKSRTQKAQYIKIQAHLLSKKFPDVSLRLIKYARENCPDDFWEQENCLNESECYAALGNIEAAIERVQASIQWRQRKPNVHTHNIYFYAKLVGKFSFERLYQNALEILNQYYEPSPFPAIVYMFFAYSAILYDKIGQTAKANERAALAIEQTKKDINFLQNERKQGLGLFKSKYEWPYDEILRIAKRKN